MIDDSELTEIELRCSKAQNGPWKAFIEGKNHQSGSNFIMTGEGDQREEDIELLGAIEADYDFIAHARQDVPKLLLEVRRLKNS